jgi:hypothetical protein
MNFSGKPTQVQTPLAIERSALEMKIYIGVDIARMDLWEAGN